MGNYFQSARQINQSQYGAYCNRAVSFGLQPMSYDAFKQMHNTMSVNAITQWQVSRYLQPSAAQMQTIALIRRNLGIHFYGYTKQDADSFINKYIDQSRSVAARRARRMAYY